VAQGLIQAEAAVQPVPCLEITWPGAPPDIALVDVAVYDERFVAARAVWEPGRILELILARAEPGSIGLSSIGAHLGLSPAGGHGLYLRMGDGGARVLAPIGPGLVAPVSVAEHQVLAAGDQVRVSRPRPCTLAFDGEREVALAAQTEVRIRLKADGPRVVDVRRAMALAAQAGVFVT
jgi:hypothetical protein